jgi:uncharacterized protein with NRDE domain
VSDFLRGSENPDNYLKKLSEKADVYNGFNLILGEKESLYWYSNRSEEPHHLSPGIYGLSNHLLDTPWPKVKRSKDALVRQISGEKNLSPEALFRILNDRTIPDDNHLPSTGVDLEWERILSSIFIESSNYGTRSSTLLFIDNHDKVTFFERTFTPSHDQVSTVKHLFTIET